MRASRTDGNQTAIVSALRKAGATVQTLHTVGAGCPDIVCGFRSENYLMELKQTKGKVNKLQKEWHDNWRGHVFVVRSVDEALDAIGVTK